MEIDMTNKKFRRLKKFNFSDATVTLWIVFRNLNNKVANYKVKNVKIDSSLENKLIKVLELKINACNGFTEYNYFNADADNELLTINADQTDFSIILEGINNGADCEFVKTNEDLAKTWAYIIKIENDKEFILGYKKTEEKWDIKKRHKRINMIFKDQKFIDLKEEDVFKIEKSVDFIYFSDVLFVTNKAKFELGLNFREGMKNKRDEVLKEFESLSIVSDIDKIRNKIGQNMHYLRQIATINKNGYFRHKNFMDKLYKVNESEGWGLSIIENEIQVDDDNIDVVLKVLNKDRLKDLIEGETFDVNVKKSVSIN